MKRIFVKPGPGKKAIAKKSKTVGANAQPVMPRKESGERFNPKGEEVNYTPFICRLLRTGDLVETDRPKAKPAKASKES